MRFIIGLKRLRRRDEEEGNVRNQALGETVAQKQPQGGELLRQRRGRAVREDLPEG